MYDNYVLDHIHIVKLAIQIINERERERERERDPEGWV